MVRLSTLFIGLTFTPNMIGYKNNNNEKSEISDRNQNPNGAHKRAESYNINGKKADAYDMLNETKEDDKINL